jgi:phytoene dehydrogenase-like protein
MDMGDSVIIVGAGVAGLATGCYAQMNGYKTQILEMHDKPGGLCTAWERQGYTIDGCIHWLTGSAPGNSFYDSWEELGLFPGTEIINLEQFYRVESAEGKVFTLYTDIDRLEAHMKELAPEDNFAITEFTKAVRHFTKLHMPVDKAPELASKLDNIRMVARMAPYLTDLAKWGRLTMKDFSGHFRNPLLQQAWQTLFLPEMSAISALITISTMHEKKAGYPIGGSLPMARAMEKRYRGLGGAVRYQARVTQILVEKDRVIGVKLADNTECRADAVIWAADGHTAIFELLGGKYADEKTRGYYNNLPTFPAIVYVGLGVKRSFPDTPKLISGLSFPLEAPLTLAGQERRNLHVRIHNFDPTLAPAGKTVLTIMLESDYDYWAELAKDKARYKTEKEALANALIGALDKRFPGLAADVEMRDVSTPLTFKRYTGNWKGSFEGWLPTPQAINLTMKKTLPGLDNFYMAGQWVQPGGGLPSGAMTGRYVIQILCKKDKKQFVATKP